MENQERLLALLQGLDVPDAEDYLYMSPATLNILGRRIGRQVKRSSELQAALTELVALKDMKDQLSMMLLREEGGMGVSYDRRNPLAWARARELVEVQVKPLP